MKKPKKHISQISITFMGMTPLDFLNKKIRSDIYGAVSKTLLDYAELEMDVKQLKRRYCTNLSFAGAKFIFRAVDNSKQTFVEDDDEYALKDLIEDATKEVWKKGCKVACSRRLIY